MAIRGFDFEHLTITKVEAVNFLNEFNILSSRDMEELDRCVYIKINDYLCTFNFYRCFSIRVFQLFNV